MFLTGTMFLHSTHSTRVARAARVGECAADTKCLIDISSEMASIFNFYVLDFTNKLKIV